MRIHPVVFPTGAVVATAFATPGGCSGTPTWISDPVPSSIPAGSAASLTLVLHRNGQASVTFDFQDDIKAVSTVAGVAGTSGNSDVAPGLFGAPEGVWSDGKGSLYLTDAGNCTVRQLAVATGALSTIAGAAGACANTDGAGAAARFSTPRAITGDGAGNLFVSDLCAVRRIALAGLAVSTVAGGPCTTPSVAADGVGAAAKFISLAGITTDGTNLYLVDNGDFTVRSMAIASASVTTIAGAHGQKATMDGVGAAARFSNPVGLALDGAGNLFVGDVFAIRRLTLATLNVVTFAGLAGQKGTIDGVGSSALFQGVFGLTADGAGNLWLSDGNAIRKLYTQTAAVVTVAGAAAAPTAAAPPRASSRRPSSPGTQPRARSSSSPTSATTPFASFNRSPP